MESPRPQSYITRLDRRTTPPRKFMLNPVCLLYCNLLARNTMISRYENQSNKDTHNVMDGFGSGEWHPTPWNLTEIANYHTL